MLAAVQKLEELPAFGEKEAIKEDLTVRATQQQTVLAEREAGNGALTKKKSEARRVVLECAMALLALKAELGALKPSTASTGE